MNKYFLLSALLSLVQAASGLFLPSHDGYIAVLKNDISTETFEKHAAGKVSFNIGGHFRGFKIDEISEILNFENSGILDFLEPNGYVHTWDVEEHTPSWGLSRISYRDHPTRKQFQKYRYDHHSGAGVTLYSVSDFVQRRYRNQYSSQ